MKKFTAGLFFLIAFFNATATNVDNATGFDKNNIDQLELVNLGTITTFSKSTQIYAMVDDSDTDTDDKSADCITIFKKLENHPANSCFFNKAAFLIFTNVRLGKRISNIFSNRAVLPIFLKLQVLRI